MTSQQPEPRLGPFPAGVKGCCLTTEDADSWPPERRIWGQGRMIVRACVMCFIKAQKREKALTQTPEGGGKISST